MTTEANNPAMPRGPLPSAHARLRRRLFAVSIVALLSAGIAGDAWAAVYGFLKQDALRYFDAEDARLMTQNLDAALADPAEDSPRDWRNAATGNHGSAVVTGSFEHDGMDCRRVRVNNHARGIDNTATADMCRVEGVWKVLRLPE